MRFYGEADAIHENDDVVHCTNDWTSKDANLTLRQPALESLLCKELRYVGSKYPVCSVIRLRKFIRRGWVINAGQILKMMMQVSELDLTNRSEEHTSELQSLMRISYAVFCLKKQNNTTTIPLIQEHTN